MAYKPTDPVLAKVSDQEPIFVLRAQDVTAPLVIEHWLEINPQITGEKLEEAKRCILAMHNWPNRKRAD